jgi:hypothetical protein
MNCLSSQGRKSSSSSRSHYSHSRPSPSYINIPAKNTQYCTVCTLPHDKVELCESKPFFSPRQIFYRCDICEGHHPANLCYFEDVRRAVSTFSYCDRCRIEHKGFCNDQVYCAHCNAYHNAKDECTRNTVQDLSNNICPNCTGIHSLHCHKDLLTVTSRKFFWCNRCKLKHQFMKCVPFCIKCGRNHREYHLCPPVDDYCNACGYSHHKDPCPLSFPPVPPRTQTSSSSTAQPLLQAHQQFYTDHRRQTGQQYHQHHQQHHQQQQQPQSQRGEASSTTQGASSNDNIYDCAEDCDQLCCQPVHFYTSPELDVETPNLMPTNPTHC